MPSLITIAEIQEKKDLTSNVKGVRVQQHIDDAEFMDLRPLLGEKFYIDLLANRAQNAYASLLSGAKYTYNDFEYEHPGIKAVIIEFAYARYQFFGNAVSTGFGMVEKQYQDGAQLERGMLKERYKAGQQKAMALWQQVKDFLDRSDTFEEWNCADSGLPAGRFRMRHIS